MNYFIYNNEYSKDYGLLFETLPTLPLTGFTETEDPMIQCYVGMAKDDNNLLMLRKWLSNIEGTLSFSFDERVWKVNNIVTREVKRNSTFLVFEIIFHVDRYCVLESSTITQTDNFDNISILNLGNFTTYPKITIEGYGNISINLNDTNICTIEDVQGLITIDSELQECWVGDSIDITSIKNEDMYGKFPVFDIGINRLVIDSTTNNITKVHIDCRWTI